MPEDSPATDARHDDMTPAAGSALPPDATGADRWRAFFAPYSHLVLVANSDEVDMASLQESFGEGTLFVFFNKVYKVLDGTFHRPALLVSRSGMMGANIIHRREAAEVLGHFAPAGFLGILNVTIGNQERFSPAAEFGAGPVAHLDLEPVVADLYPPRMVPTTGFGLCLWLDGLDLPASITLAGFSSRRSERWKVFDIHDWTFEQVVLRLIFRKGRIDLRGRDRHDPYAALARHLPGVTPDEILRTADEVLSERLSGLSRMVDRLMSVTKPLRYVDELFRKLRPKTRKQKFLRRQGGDKAGR